MLNYLSISETGMISDHFFIVISLQKKNTHTQDTGLVIKLNSKIQIIFLKVYQIGAPQR